MSASDIDSAIFADHLWSITRKHTLKLIAGQPTTGAVVELHRRVTKP
jgi:hypothetical protein